MDDGIWTVCSDPGCSGHGDGTSNAARRFHGDECSGTLEPAQDTALESLKNILMAVVIVLRSSLRYNGLHSIEPMVIRRSYCGCVQ
jgi:hypothetical protein